jgi:membrane-bound acyltransferase YfiQ involved in biofilm formation
MGVAYKNYKEKYNIISNLGPHNSYVMKVQKLNLEKVTIFGIVKQTTEKVLLGCWYGLYILMIILMQGKQNFYTNNTDINLNEEML